MAHLPVPGENAEDGLPFAFSRSWAAVIRRLAAAAAFLTVVLIVAGGLVTNTDSGLACPAWPTCFGRVVPKMVGGVAVEHTHRLIATAVGLCTVALVVLTLRRARQGWLAAV